ncbi:hypothetical protein AYP77_03005 [Lactobacillus crispatus]|uniref:hypothetical protein n=1 Tax=Lactobacillus crispatus TaxID=47770 RepID=UPI000B5D9EA7|nr:hypothetical protein [Lactobacillus crispatus]OXC16391.1 hypothetical protein AYP77_03005 [Lactobacillus crispatus]
MKPNTRILNYVTLVQDGVLTLDDVPQDIAKEVTKWVRYLAGIKDETMVKDPDATKPAVEDKPVDYTPAKTGDITSGVLTTKKVTQ